MKRWIHASTRDIEYKTRDYLAAWAKDSCKSGKPIASMREFKEEMKAEGLKADETDYDYYVACYNNACELCRKKKVKASKDLVAPWNNPDLKFICNTDGYLVYRIIEDGRGKWYAHEQDAPIETMVPITYEQARGYEPMPNESSIRKLQRELGEMLLPPV